MTAPQRKKLNFEDPLVAEKFADFETKARKKLLGLRDLIFTTAAKNGVGALEETLKWGEPAYLTPETKSGTTIRINTTKDGGYAIYFSCQTTMIAEIKKKFGKTFRYEGKRALLFNIEETPPKKETAECLKLALTYHRRKKA